VLTDLVRKLYPFNYSVTGSGNDSAVRLLNDHLDFDVTEWSSGSELNGWVIPQAHTVEKAELWLGEELIYDGSASALGVPAQSDSFEGLIELEELNPHLFSDPKHPEAIPAHWTRLYRPDDQLWGFCLPDELKQSLKPGTYRVNLQTRFEPSTMKVLSYVLPGESDDTFLFNAHNCHPFQANDDASGMAVGIELMRRLQQKNNRKFTYQLLIAPELFGTMFWSDSLPPAQISNLRGTVMLKSVGNSRALRLQQSFDPKSLVGRAANSTFQSKYGEFESGVFRSIYGNDETVFESPPYQIPSISLTRWPFDEYHSNLDTPDRLLEDSLQDTLDTALSICEELEAAGSYFPRFTGVPNLSRHNLYKSLPFSGDSPDYKCVGGRWHRLMNTLPSLLGAGLIINETAKEFELPASEITEYLQRWIDAGLVEKR
jgi:aminopeptidase-like protein